MANWQLNCGYTALGTQLALTVSYDNCPQYTTKVQIRDINAATPRELADCLIELADCLKKGNSTCLRSSSATTNAKPSPSTSSFTPSTATLPGQSP